MTKWLNKNKGKGKTAMSIIRNQGSGKTDELEKMIYTLQERGVIDSDLADRMITMMRLRTDLIQEYEEKNPQVAIDIIWQDVGWVWKEELTVLPSIMLRERAIH